MTDPRSPWVKLRRNPAVVVSAGILFVAALAAIFGPSLLPASAGEVTRNSFLPPSHLHFFGTDLNGRDLLYRVLLGARISLLVGVTGALVSFAVGIGCFTVRLRPSLDIVQKLICLRDARNTLRRRYSSGGAAT